MMSEDEWLDLMNRTLRTWRDKLARLQEEERELKQNIQGWVDKRSCAFPRDRPELQSRVKDADGHIFTVLWNEAMTFFGPMCQCGIPSEFWGVYDAGWRSLYDLTVIDEEEFQRLRESIQMELDALKSD